MWKSVWKHFINFFCSISTLEINTKKRFKYNVFCCRLYNLWKFSTIFIKRFANKIFQKTKKKRFTKQSLFEGTLYAVNAFLIKNSISFHLCLICVQNMIYMQIQHTSLFSCWQMKEFRFLVGDFWSCNNLIL